MRNQPRTKIEIEAPTQTPVRIPTDRRVEVDRPLVAFFGIAFILGWGVWFLLGQLAGAAGMEPVDFVDAIESGRFEVVESPVPDWLLYVLTRVLDFSFTIAGLVMIAVTGGVDGLRQLGRRLVNWRIPARWYLAGLIPAVLYGISAFAASRPGGVAPDISLATLNTILFSLSSGLLVSLFLRGAFGEELGLRGFALTRLQQRTTPAKASLIIGLGWALWHLPVLVERHLAIAALLVVWIVGVSFIFTWLFNGSGGSLIPPLLFHATQNWEEGFEVIYPGLGGTDWDAPATLVLIPVALIVAGRVRRQGDARTEGSAHD